MDWVEILGYVASGAVFVTFWMRNIIPLRIIAIIGNTLYFAYGFHADLGNILALHGALLPLNMLRLYQAYSLRRRLHEMAHADFDPLSLTAFMTKTSSKKGEYLFKRGDNADAMYYLMDGKVLVEELNIELTAGRMIGEIAMFTPDKQRTQSIRCLEDCALMKITEEKALQLHAENPEFGLYLTKMIVGRLLSNTDNGRGLRAA